MNHERCVIGERTQKELFEEEEEPVGKFIRIDDIYFQVIGVHKFVPKEEVSKVMGIYLSHLQLLENCTIQETMWIGSPLPLMTMSVDVVQVEKDVKQTLKRIHRVAPKDEREFWLIQSRGSI